ncbi:MAG: hypothetical protein IT384_22630 [Deltaproteobacteria bacterium]|nr:hypothetical protein [Deltaproteobacteria bacterium]
MPAGLKNLRSVRDTDPFIQQTRVVPLLHRRSRIPVDVVLAGPGIEEGMLARARKRRVGRDLEIPFVVTSDPIALKILAGRPKDLDDVRALLRAQPPELSLPAARRTVRRLGALLADSTLLETLDRLVAEARPRAQRRARPPRGRARRSGARKWPR